MQDAEHRNSESVRGQGSRSIDLRPECSQNVGTRNRFINPQNIRDWQLDNRTAIRGYRINLNEILGQAG